MRRRPLLVADRERERVSLLACWCGKVALMPDEPSFADVEARYAERLAAMDAGSTQRLRDAAARLDAASSVGGWVEPPRAPGAGPTLPVPQLSIDAAALITVINSLDIDIPFDWPHWSRGRWLAEKPDHASEATPAEAAMLINTVQRFDRFSDGALLKAFEDGVVQAAARRMLEA